MAWCICSQSSLLNIYFRVSGFQSSVLLILFNYAPNTCFTCGTEPIPYVTLQSEIAPLLKSHRNHCSCAWTEGVSGLVPGILFYVLRLKAILKKLTCFAVPSLVSRLTGATIVINLIDACRTIQTAWNLEFRSSKITEPFNDVQNIRRFELGTIGCSPKKRLFSLTFE